MPIKKSELYSSLWASCDELRGGMDASQYKDYVLVLLFIKYISDKYAGVPFAPISVPAGASFADMVALKGKSDIGDRINKYVIAELARANSQLSVSDFPDFNDATKLGSGKEMVDRLTNLIAIFENKALDFSQNRAGGDDILGDAYEFLMRHFATESGKSKGQFYTPAEVSRIMAQILGIREAETSASTTVYDPTCGSGSLLLKVGDEAGTPVSLYGQEKDAATSGLARMNMVLHNYPTALISQGNTLTNPKYKNDDDGLQTFDYVVANPPFSDKRWSTGIEDPLNDKYERFHFGVPPAKQGDYAYLLHIVRSLKSNGKGACILPHGVLFRGNAEAEIRRNLVKRGYIRAIIGLPANLFYGTGIPACIIVIDKEAAHTRKGIFMIDASGGFAKDGPKNRLRERDIHKIVDVFSKRQEVPKYARMVSLDEIERNEFNLNLPRYIDSQEAEDLQDIHAHLRGGIPTHDLDAMHTVWGRFPSLRSSLFRDLRPGYLELRVPASKLKETIYAHPEFSSFMDEMDAHFGVWRDQESAALRGLGPGCQPKSIIAALGEGLLRHYAGVPLVDGYAIYQHLMDYVDETLQDDLYLIAAEGWRAETSRIIEVDKKGAQKDQGWTCELLPKEFVVREFFNEKLLETQNIASALENIIARRTELEEEQGGEEGAFGELEKINKGAVVGRIKELKAERHCEEGALPDAAISRQAGDCFPSLRSGQAAEKASARNDDDELGVLEEWLDLYEEEGRLKKAMKAAEAELDAAAYSRYPKLSVEAIQKLVVDEKWLAALENAIQTETQNLASRLTTRLKELAERYATPLPRMSEQVAELEAKVNQHLEKMGFSWQ